jgi:2-polyprenyl-3-methyl-5-hydroxy-6-metoxy-1,4-benzoquinol methylase
LCYPYPESDADIVASGRNRDGIESTAKIKSIKLEWHLKSGARNHNNFTNMASFAMDDNCVHKKLRVLDYGGGGGQFAVTLRSLYPLTETYIVDICDAKLLDQFKCMNQQIRFTEFATDSTRYHYIFLNDVFEHVSDPINVLADLSSRLIDRDSRVFIDTPCQFWLYPVTKMFSPKIHTKLLRGTVGYDHQQIWSKKSFCHVVGKAGFRVVKYVETTEFTQPAEFYMDNMKISNPIVRLAGKIFYRLAPRIAKNKIMALLAQS